MEPFEHEIDRLASLLAAVHSRAQGLLDGFAVTEPFSRLALEEIRDLAALRRHPELSDGNAIDEAFIVLAKDGAA